MQFCPLCSGSSGNASYLFAGGAQLLIDAGLPGSHITELLAEANADPAALSGILVTHEHVDHVRGVGVLSRRYHIPVYATAATWTAMTRLIGTLPAALMRVIEPDREFILHTCRILPFSTPHDAAGSVGYVFSAEQHKLALMTDIGHVSGRMLEAVSGADLVLLEANHDVDMLKAGSYPYPLKMRILSARGHLSNEDAGRVLAHLYESGVRSAILGHLSRENNTPELALLTVKSVLAEAGIGDEMFVTVANREHPTGIFEIT